MKNIGSKIVILTMLVLLACGSIAWFYYSQVKPPEDYKFENEHEKLLKNVINEFDYQRGFNFNDSLFVSINNKIVLCGSEGFLNRNQLKVIKSELVENFVRVFSLLCDDEFDKSTWWDKAKIARIKYLTEEALRLKPANSTLGDIQRKVNNYEDACRLANVNSYDGVERAKQNIKKAKDYYKEFSKCKPLASALSYVNINIRDNHKGQIVYWVNRMTDYKRISKWDFDGAKRYSTALINDFEWLTNNGYYSAISLSNIKSRRNAIIGEAERYYEVVIVEQNQWRKTIGSAVHMYETEKGANSSNCLTIELNSGNYQIYAMCTGGSENYITIDGREKECAKWSQLSTDYYYWPSMEVYGSRTIKIKFHKIRSSSTGQARIVVVKK